MGKGTYGDKVMRRPKSIPLSLVSPFTAAACGLGFRILGFTGFGIGCRVEG
jgi:hypothetical protein